MCIRDRFMTWEGYNYEDAVLLSERLVMDDVYTSVHIEEDVYKRQGCGSVLRKYAGTCAECAGWRAFKESNRQRRTAKNSQI